MNEYMRSNYPSGALLSFVRFVARACFASLVCAIKRSQPFVQTDFGKREQHTRAQASLYINESSQFLVGELRPLDTARAIFAPVCLFSGAFDSSMPTNFASDSEASRWSVSQSVRRAHLCVCVAIAEVCKSEIISERAS